MSKTAKRLFSISALAGASLMTGTAFADGAVKVECWGNCDQVTLGNVCQMYTPGTKPVGISCAETLHLGQGSGTTLTCADNDTCVRFGSYGNNDPLGQYCLDVGGLDAIVYCR